VQLRVGADVEIERVALEIKGVEAQAQLKARLDNVRAIIERALDTVDNNPELLTELARSAQRAAGGLGEAVAKVGEEGGQLVEEAGQLAEGAAQATGSSSARQRSRPRSSRGGSESGSKPRKRNPSRP
jgi:methyl-accepting chemotaxis protein